MTTRPDGVNVVNDDAVDALDAVDPDTGEETDERQPLAELFRDLRTARTGLSVREAARRLPEGFTSPGSQATPPLYAGSIRS